MTPRAADRRGRSLRVVLACGSVVALVSGLLAACNAVLGIDSAKLVPADAGMDAAPLNPYALNCPTYCTVINQVCSTENPPAPNTEYLTDDVCLRICNAAFPPPVADGFVDASPPLPTTGDLYCRLWHVNYARMTGDIHVHCPHAGPLGGNTCDDDVADPCAVFCNLDQRFCPDPFPYASVADCEAMCRPDGSYPGFPYQVDPNTPAVTDLQTTGNTLNCRMYHLENAMVGDPGLHCPHTGPNGGGPGFCVN